MRFFCLILLGLGFFSNQLMAQSTAFVLNGGLTMGIQRWDGFDREPLFAWHGALSIESVENEEDKASLFAQFGYHVKGSATRFININQGSGFPNGTFSEEFRFNQISSTFGAKSKRPLGVTGRSKWYYFGGIRCDYTLSTNIDELGAANQLNRLYYPQVNFMNRWLFGAAAGAGIEFKWTELLGGEVKLSVCPDFTLQYNQPPIPNVIDPWNPGSTTTIGERRIRNTAIELSFGLRLLRKVEYVE
jgi:hypothetical protein